MSRAELFTPCWRYDQHPKNVSESAAGTVISRLVGNDLWLAVDRAIWALAVCDDIDQLLKFELAERAAVLWRVS